MYEIFKNAALKMALNPNTPQLYTLNVSELTY